MKFLLGIIGFFLFLTPLAAQQTILSGTITDEGGKPLQGASVQIVPFTDSTKKVTLAADKAGFFTIQDIPFNYYKVKVSYVGLQSVTLDSINVRKERSDFNLGEIVLKQKNSGQMSEIIVYAEKPLIQSKDGNITFNASESALSNGSNASDLLENVPLVTKDPDGKLLVKGKEPKILIDDKPVNLNLQQMQDLLESLPGSSIEKIEVMTNPPPQYANEQGGVINIVTKKGTVGMGARLTAYAGTRGERGGNASFNYRRNGLVFNVNGGFITNTFQGYGYSTRQNQFIDSTNQLKTNNNYLNDNTRPNVRMNFEYDLTKYQNLNLVLQYNGNTYDNNNLTRYNHLNRYEYLYKSSTRNINSIGDNNNKSIAFNYTLKTQIPGESFKLHTNYGTSLSHSDRYFYQQFFNDAGIFTGQDSTQTQATINKSKSYYLQLSYDRPLANKRTFISVGSTMNTSTSDVNTDAAYKRKLDGTILPLDLLSNDFTFHQYVYNYRGSFKQLFTPDFSLTAGMAAEKTDIKFDLYKSGTDTSNNYWTYLPYATLSKTWKDVLNLSFSYKKSIRRPGINELNPSIDFSDPYNTRFGNPDLEASTAHNFDLVVGKTKTAFYANLGVGYNIVQDIYSQIRTLMPDGRTQITWYNISGRKEYQMNGWTGYNVNRKVRFNLSASYTYNKYSDYDKQYRNFRDGSSFTSNLNTNYTWKDLYSANMNFTLNRWANPQGTVKNTLRMNMGVQARVIDKKLTIALNAIDPFTKQENRLFTYGKNFTLENFNSTQTRNYRLSLSYNLRLTSTNKNANTIRKKADAISK